MFNDLKPTLSSITSVLFAGGTLFLEGALDILAAIAAIVAGAAGAYNYYHAAQLKRAQLKQIREELKELKNDLDIPDGDAM